MHQRLNGLPLSLLNRLGTYSRLEALAGLPQVEAHLNTLRQRKHVKPYHINGPGLSLMLQCLNPQASSEEPIWGLQSFTLQAGAWEGGWPEGLNINTATAEDLIALLAEKAEEVMNMPPMVCFGIPGAAGQTWSVMAVFDSTSGKLDTFSLLRVGPWRELPVTQPG